MKIWYQTYLTVGIDPEWNYYGETLRKHLSRVAKPDTQIDIHGVAKLSPKMLQSSYIQYLHTAQVIEKALEAERRGYDAFVLGGMRDIGYSELREAVDIPVLFIAETSYLVACLLAPKFSVIYTTKDSLKAGTALAKRYGLMERHVPGIELGIPAAELTVQFGQDPKGVIDIFTTAARSVIKKDVGVLVPGYGGLSVFLVENGIRDIDGVPVLDNQAVLIKMAEMMVELKANGLTGSRGRRSVSKEDMIAARKLYGVE